MESDTDVSDEDVLFENSPLYQHLLETGVQVENISTAINSTSCKETRENCDSEADSHQHLVKAGIAHRCAECFINIFTTLLGINQLKTELKQMKLFYGTKILQESLKHDMLEEDDKNYLEHFSGLKSQQHQQGKRDPALVSKIILMFGIPILVSYFSGRLMWPSYPWKYKGISDALSVVTAVYFLLLIGKALYLARHKWALEGILQEVTEMLGAGREFFRMTGKCLRLIQETELVARGFTLVSQKSPLCRMEQNGMLGYQRQCPQLRQQLFVLCRDCMIATKNWTRQLLARDPIPAERSFNFLANIPLEEYGPCLQIKGENSESHKHLEEITDGFSISAIKGVNQVCRLQYSELCRSVILRVLQSLESNNFKGDFPKTQDIQDRLELSTKELGTLHAYYDSVSNPSETLPQKQDLSKMNDLDIAVHSLDLHLQAALLRVRKLSVLTKHLTNEDTENGHMTKSNHNQSMETMLDQVKQELLACKGCWEEGLERLQKLYKHQTSQVEKPDEDKKPMVHTPIPVDTPPVDLFNTGPPIIQDEVFEAYIDEENDAEGPDYSWDEYLSPEEKERKKKEKQEALRLLTELKSVISVRAEEMGRREKIAKERKYGPETCEDKNIGKPAEKVCDQHINENDENSLHKELISQDNLRHLTVDPSQNNSRLSSEQFKTKVLDDDDDESERGPIEDQERDSMEGGRMFITGTDDDSTDCSLRSFPHFVPREGVLPIQSPSFQFSSNLAAMAVARSRDFGLSEDTFGDSESDSDQRSETSSPLN